MRPRAAFIIGLLAAIVLMLAYPRSHRATAVHIDWLGAALLFGGIFLGCIGWFLSTMPVMQIWEAPSEPHPDLLDDPRQPSRPEGVAGSR